MFDSAQRTADFDPDLAAAMAAEVTRQEDHVELIASENYASPRVMEAQGSVLTNKYAEGYPGKRYYGGWEHVDVAEQLAIERLCALYDCDYATAGVAGSNPASPTTFIFDPRFSVQQATAGSTTLG